jgi:hypothetical protein
MKVNETYRMNMKSKEPEAVDSASVSEFTLPDNVDELSPCILRYFGTTLLLKILLNNRYTTQNEFVVPI